MGCQCGPCGCKGISAIVLGFIAFGVAVFFVTDIIDKARYQKTVNFSSNPNCAKKLVYDEWYYAIKDLGPVGKFEVALRFHVQNSTQYAHGRVVTGSMFMCQAHTGTPKVDPTVCPNAWLYNEASCDLAFQLSKCSQDLAKTKTDLHLTAVEWDGSSSRIVVNFNSNFGGGLYNLSQSTNPDVLKNCKLPSTASKAVSSTLLKTDVKAKACPSLAQKQWYYGMHDLGAALGKFEVGLYMDGGKAYLCEAHTGMFKPVPATVCENDFTHDDSSCTLSITPSQCTQDLGNKQTDLHLQSAQRETNGSIGLSFTSHFGGGVYQLSTTSQPDKLTDCKLPSAAVSFEVVV